MAELLPPEMPMPMDPLMPPMPTAPDQQPPMPGGIDPTAIEGMLNQVLGGDEGEGLGEEAGAEGTPNITDGEEQRELEEKFQKSVQYDLSEEEKKTIGQYIKKFVDDCTSARSAWEQNLQECMDLYEGVRPPKSVPWEGCSNITTMAVPMHAKLMHSRLYPTVWNENLIYWQPREKGDVDNVDKVSKFMRWVVEQELKLGDKIDDTLQDLIVTGTVAVKVTWTTEYRKVADKDDPSGYKEIAHQKAKYENVPIDEVYLPWFWEGEDASEAIAQDIFMRLPEVKNLRSLGHFVVSDKDIEAMAKAAENKVSDVVKARVQKSGIEGSAEFYAHLNSAPIRLIECQMPWTIGGVPRESVFIIDYETGAYLSGKPLTAISPTGKRTWVIGQFMRRTGRPYGVGLPELMKGLAKELDAIHNQRIDAGSVTIAPFGFYRAASSFKPSKVQISPGAMIPVDDINDVKLAQYQANFAVSFQEERIIIEMIEKLTATSAYQMGRESDVAKSRATATGTLAIIQQGEQAYTLLGIRCQRIFSQIMTKMLELYQWFMPKGLVDRVLGEDGGLLFPEGMEINEISGGYDSYMILDATAGSKVMERQASLAMIQMAPQLLSISQDPRGYKMAEEFLTSIGKVDTERYLGPAPKTDQLGSAAGLGTFGGAGLSPDGNLPVGPGTANVSPEGMGGGGMGGPI